MRTPPADGVVTSLDVFAAADRLVMMRFGTRKPGQPEAEAWRTLAHTAAEARRC